MGKRIWLRPARRILGRCNHREEPKCFSCPSMKSRSSSVQSSAYSPSVCQTINSACGISFYSLPFPLNAASICAWNGLGCLDLMAQRQWCPCPQAPLCDEGFSEIAAVWLADSKEKVEMASAFITPPQSTQINSICFWPADSRMTSHLKPQATQR